MYNADGIEIEGFKGIVRNDNGYYLNISRDTYEMISNQETFEIVEAVTKQWAFLDTAGSVRDGRQVWALAHLDEPISITGDRSPIYPYVVMLTSHDGSAACKVLPTAVRVVCWNTFQAASARGDETGHQYVFRHTKNVKDRIEEAKQALASVRTFAAQWKEKNEALATLAVTDEAIKKFVLEFFPAPPPAVVMTDRQVDNLINARNTLDWIIKNSPTTEGIRGTAYCLVQSAGEYLDHMRGAHGRETRIARTLLKSEPMKAKAVKLALAAAKG